MECIKLKLSKIIVLIGFLTVPSHGVYLGFNTNGLDIGIISNKFLTLEAPIQYFYLNSTEDGPSYSSSVIHISDHFFGAGLQLFWFTPRFNQVSLSFGSGVSFFGNRSESVVNSYGNNSNPQIEYYWDIALKVNWLTIQPEFSFYDGLFSAYLNYTFASWDLFREYYYISFFTNSPYPQLSGTIKIGIKWDISKFLELKNQEKKTIEERPLEK